MISNKSGRKLRISVMGPVGYPGGLQTHHFELKNFLLKNGHKVFSIDVELEKTNQLIKHHNLNVAVVRWRPGYTGKLLRIFDWFNAVCKLILFKSDICLASANGYGYAIAAKVLAKNAFSVCMEVTNDFPIDDSLRKTMVKSFTATAVQSPGLLQAQREKLGRAHKIGVLPCYSQHLNQKYLANNPCVGEQLKIAFFGRLANNKGLFELIESIAALPVDMRPLCDIWGRGEIQSELNKKIQSLHLDNIVSLKGAFPGGDEYVKLLSTYHGFVLPSQFCEGLPLVLLEAASVGLPFLSTDVGAISDCAIENPDVRIIKTGQIALNEGLKKWLNALRNGYFQPSRLRDWYLKYHSRECQEEIWLDMLENKIGFFKHDLYK